MTEDTNTTPTMTPEEVRRWIEEQGPDIDEKLINPGVLRVPRDKVKEWIEREDVYITFRGVALKLNPVSAFLAHERANQVQYPDVPMKMNEDKGREEPDPFDPAYLRAYSDADTERSVVIINTFLAMGTELLWKPDDLPGVEDDSWADKLQDPAVLGKYTLEIDPKGTTGRYLQWLKYLAMSDRDYIGVPNRIQILGGGVRTEVVQRALASFPGIEERGADRGVDTTNGQPRNRNRASRRKMGK